MAADDKLLGLPPSGPTRILLVRVGAMGDILHALPAVSALRVALPDAYIGWAVEPHWRALLSPGLVDQVHEIPTRDWKEKPLSVRTLKQILGLRAELKLARYDLAVDLQGSLRSGFLARLSGAAKVVGAAVPREMPARTFYTHRVALYQPGVIAQAFELLNAATGLRLGPAPALLPEGDPLPAGEGLKPGYILISPSAGWGAKQWPRHAYQELIRRFEAAGYQVVVNGGRNPDERRAALTEDTHAVVQSSTVAELITLTRQAALVIGGDTGPMHLGAALGVPTLALFGPTDPARNGPYFPSARVKVLRHPSSQTSLKRLPGPDPGLQRITVEEVYEAALELLRHP